MFLAAPGAASARVFGGTPVNISVTPGGHRGNGASGAPAVSGDNRKTRLVAFHSDARNFVRRDTNGVTDVFVWFRPRGGRGLSLPRGAGSLRRVSVGRRGAQANGPSRNASVDGSMRHKPHCVAFESNASNLAARDRDATSDVFVRNLRTRKTVLISRGIGGAAGNPAIDGGCRRVAFEAGGRLFVASVRGGRPRSLGAGRNADYSLDGKALTWERGGGVVLRRKGRVSLVAGSGRNPTVSNAARRRWGVSFEMGNDVYMRVLGSYGGPRSTDLISAPRRGAGSLGGNSFNGGISAFAPVRGVIVFTNHARGRATMYYRNNHTGNIDDLVHRRVINEVQTSARGNFVAFSASGNVYFKHVSHGQRI